MFSFRKITSSLAYISASMFVIGIISLAAKEPSMRTNYNIFNILFGLSALDPLSFFLLGIIMLLASSIIYMCTLVYHLAKSGDKIYAFILIIFVGIMLVLFSNLVFF